MSPAHDTMCVEEKEILLYSSLIVMLFGEESDIIERVSSFSMQMH